MIILPVRRVKLHRRATISCTVTVPQQLGMVGRYCMVSMSCPRDSASQPRSTVSYSAHYSTIPVEHSWFFFSFPLHFCNLSSLIISSSSFVIIDADKYTYNRGARWGITIALSLWFLARRICLFYGYINRIKTLIMITCTVSCHTFGAVVEIAEKGVNEWAAVR